MNPAFRRLFDPFELSSGIKLPNRIVMAPMTTWSSYPDGVVHPDEIAYLYRRSEGLGAVITAACYVNPQGHAFPGQWACDNDSRLDSLALAARTIQVRGARAFLQIHHGGRMCSSAVSGHAPLSASPIPAERPGAETPREMTIEEIMETIDAFAAATRRAVQAGYDGVEIHGANTYLLQQFFSPHSNRRGDEWGGTLHRRMRFPLAVLDAVLSAASEAGRSFAVGYRISPEEIEEPGIRIEETLELIEALAERKPDWLHISTRDYRAGSLLESADKRRPTRLVIEKLAGGVPVIGVGGIITPSDAMFALDDGCALAALGRVLLTEPEWVLKVLDGEADDIRSSLPAENAENLLTLPRPLYDRLLAVPGWLKVAD